MTSLNSVAEPERTVEGIARVVQVEGARLWLEPEQSSGCGSCASSGSCGTGGGNSGGPGAPGIGTLASRLAARRFLLDELPAGYSLRVGDRIVIGVDNRALLKGSLIAYALPLGAALGAGGVAQSLYASDVRTMLGMALGFGVGLIAARIAARRLSTQGALAPRFLRRALPGETCSTL